VVQVTFDPSVISYRDILEVFFSIHDPTNTQPAGADVGTQYRFGDPVLERGTEKNCRRVIQELNSEGIWKESYRHPVGPAGASIEPKNTTREDCPEEPVLGLHARWSYPAQSQQIPQEVC
jgi:peptide-methionine (S)-S-oxide reductase